MAGDNLRAGAFPCVLLGCRFRLRTDHRVLAWLFLKEPTASARISGWLATLMEYTIVIEYVRGAENSMSDALSRLDSVAFDSEVPNEQVRGVSSFACQVFEVDRLEARTDWIAEQQSDETIAFLIDLLKRKLGQTQSVTRISRSSSFTLMSGRS